eukprot:m.115186 g.115186  ORF g.115186 m.115186 type:complete len:244 (-) comp28404_c1_seq2:233-964(-)
MGKKKGGGKKKTQVKPTADTGSVAVIAPTETPKPISPNAGGVYESALYLEALMISEIPTEAYVRLYRSICFFLRDLGKVMGFVVTDVENKLEVLEKEHRANPDTHGSLHTMVQKEVDADVVNTNKQSASRTLLRLHRAIKFIEELLNGLISAPVIESSSIITTRAYTEFLGKHHSWIVRKTCTTAFMALPSREKLVAKVQEHCKSGDEAEHVDVGPQKVIAVMGSCFEIVQAVLDSHDLLELP